MNEFNISPEKLESIRVEHAENSWVSWVRSETDAKCWEMFNKRFTPEMIAEVAQKVEFLGGWDNFANYLQTTPEFQEMREKHAIERQDFLASLKKPDQNE